jgi:uncharacterized membrane protein
MPKTVVGLFDSHEHAEQAVRDLIAAGYDSRTMSVVATDPEGHFAKHTVDKSGDLASSGAVAGGASGLVLGGLLGLLVGAATIAAPPVGVMVAGPVVGMLTGAGLGLVGGTIVGALIGLGIPDEEVHVYAESIRHGSVLVSVQVPDGDLAAAEALLVRNGAINIQERAAVLRQNGFTTFDQNAPVLSREQILAERQRLGIATPVATVPVTGGVVTGTVTPAAGTTVVTETVTPATGASYIAGTTAPVAGTTVVTDAATSPVTGGYVTEAVTPVTGARTYVTETVAPVAPITAATTEIITPATTVGTTVMGGVVPPTADDDAFFRTDFQTRYPAVAGTFETFRPAYHFGYELAFRPEFKNRVWSDVQSEARLVWEQRNPGTWERYLDAVAAGWTRAHSLSPTTNPGVELI